MEQEEKRKKKKKGGTQSLSRKKKKRTGEREKRCTGFRRGEGKEETTVEGTTAKRKKIS
jgi:hypothetical protein